MLEQFLKERSPNEDQLRAGLRSLLQLLHTMTRAVRLLQGPRGYSFFLGSLWQRLSEQLPSGHAAETHVGAGRPGGEGLLGLS